MYVVITATSSIRDFTEQNVVFQNPEITKCRSTLLQHNTGKIKTQTYLNKSMKYVVLFKLSGTNKNIRTLFHEKIKSFLVSSLKPYRMYRNLTCLFVARGCVTGTRHPGE
jgi:hypothetical protein